MNIADKARLADDPYAFSIARFSLRSLVRDNRQITFKFEDESEITFNISYEVAV